MPPSQKPSRRSIAAVVVAAVLMGASWFLGRMSAAEDSPSQPTPAIQEVADAGPGNPSNPALQRFVDNPTASQLSYLRLSDGMRMGTATERYARPALSLIKLYIAEYIIEHGTEAEKYEALAMVSDSSDASAEDLFEKYPDSIDDVAKRYGLYSTRSDERWGYSVTSTYDVVNFIAKLKEDNPTHPILVAMSQAHSIAADGYEQDFGTARLQNVIGTKFGWSNDFDLHSSVSFGENFVVAAAVNGSADDLTQFVKTQVTGAKLKEATRFHVNQRRAERGLPPLPKETSTTKKASTTKKPSSTKTASRKPASTTKSPAPSSEPSSTASTTSTERRQPRD